MQEESKVVGLGCLLDPLKQILIYEFFPEKISI